MCIHLLSFYYFFSGCFKILLFIRSSFCFHFCDLMIFSSMFVFLSFEVLCIYYMFFVCGYHWVHICWYRTTSTCFKLEVILVQTHSKKKSTVFIPLPHILCIQYFALHLNVYPLTLPICLLFLVGLSLSRRFFSSFFFLDHTVWLVGP